MKRRELIKIGIASLPALILGKNHLISQEKKFSKSTLLKPKRLKPGDTVGIVAPATHTPSLEEITDAKLLLEQLELKPIFGRTFQDKSGNKTKPPELRAQEINEMFSNPEINAIFSIRGGYGSVAILDKIDYELIRKNPKIFLGYSDITALLIAIRQLSGITTLHSPMLLSQFQGNFDLFKKILFTTENNITIENPNLQNIRKKNFYTIKDGTAEGEITGGNLSLITSLIGTDYEIETKDKILFIEDVGEPPYRIDRMLYQMKFSRKFDNIRGLIFGKCNDCDSTDSNIFDKSLLDVLYSHFSNYDFPSFYGLMIGHTPTQYPLPLGVQATMDATNGKVILNESYCVE